MNQSDFELNIDKLVLDGIDISDQYRFSLGLQHELQRLFVERGVPSGITDSISVPSINAGSINTGNGESAYTIGTRVAHTIYGGIKV